MPILRKIWLWGLLSCGLTSCVVPTAVHESDGTTPPLSIAKSAATTELSFVDFDTFDRELSNALNVGANEVVVTFAAPANINQIPPRVTPWLTTVQDTAGKIEPQPQSKTRFLGISAIPVVFNLVKAAYNYYQEAALYKPATNYNVAIPYNSADGNIQKIIFKNKNFIAP